MDFGARMGGGGEGGGGDENIVIWLYLDCLLVPLLHIRMEICSDFEREGKE